MTADTVVRALIDYLKAKHQLGLLPEIAQALTQASFTQTDPDLATVTAAVPLNLRQKRALQSALSGIFGRPVRLKTALDKNIIGGLRITLGGKVIDTSLKEQLTQLNEAIVYD